MLCCAAVRLRAGMSGVTYATAGLSPPELDDANALHFFGFVQLCEQLGPVELVSNLRKLAMSASRSRWACA